MTATNGQNGFASPVISERLIDEPRPLKVIYIGAGVSGIIGAIQFRKMVPTIELVMYEKNADVGGTWYENRQGTQGSMTITAANSGVQISRLCVWHVFLSALKQSNADGNKDVPSHSYQLTFESSTDWSQFYASAPEILGYWKKVAEKYDVLRLVRFQHKCIEAHWDHGRSKWLVRLLKLDGSNELVEDTADVLMTGTGVLNEWKWPDLKGLHEFKGVLLHSANWDDAFDPKDKTVAVIGAGSSGIQIVPALAGKVKSMDHYVRGKTWITNQIGEEHLKERVASSSSSSSDSDSSSNFAYTAEEKAAWKRDPATYQQYRKTLERGLQGNYAISQRAEPSHARARAAFEQQMRDRLQPKPELIEHLIPDFPPFCKRLTPGPGYLEALASPAVSVITAPISHVDATGVWTVDDDDGTSTTTHRPVDAIICATGFATAPGASLPAIHGRDGVSLRAKYAQQPRTYLGLCTDGFPNFFHALGPNAFQGAGNLLVTIEAAHAYVARILRRLATGGVATVEPKRRAVDLFARFCEEYFERTVYTADCLSWYKSAPPGATVEERMRGRVTALWPGSSVHALRALSEVRWEDFEVESCDGNEFAWFGNGWTVADRSGDAEGLTWYIRDGGLAGS